VLATSRECLALKGERILPLQSLFVPDLDASTDAAARADAVRLFVERAADARAGFELRDDNAAAIVQICRRLDGIPLAIELAAARVQAMTPEEIATRLDDQFGLLRGGTRGAVARHQTLRRAMDWSYDLLSDDERLVLQRLSVFAGGATLNDAVAVVEGDTANELDVLEQLGGLVRRSLVLADDEEGHTRYRLLETVRQYAHEHLFQAGTADTTHRRHAVHYAALAVEAGRGLRGADQLAWLARLAPEMDNLRAAQAWAIDQHELDLALDVIVSLCVIGTTVEHAAIQWGRALATDAGVDTRPLGPTLLALAAFDAAVGWPDRARATAFEARRIAAEAALGRPPNPANLRAPTTLAQHFGTPADAVDCARRWVEAARAAGDRYETVEALTIFAATMVDTDLQAAISVMEECVAEARELACPSSLAIALLPLGAHLLHTDPKQSVVILEEVVRVGTTVGFRFAVGAAYSVLAWAYHALGDQRAGLQARRQALDLNLAVGGGESLAGSFVAIAVLLTAFGDDEAAAVLQGAATAVPDQAGGMDEVRALIPVLRERLGDDRLREMLARGSAMPDDESVAYAHAKLDAIEASLPADD
jgi:predicted ATPase